MNLMKQLEEAEKLLKINNEWNDLISEKQAAEKFSCSMATIRRLRREGKISKYFTVNGRHIMLSKLELIKLLKNPA